MVWNFFCYFSKIFMNLLNNKIILLKYLDFSFQLKCFRIYNKRKCFLKEVGKIILNIEGFDSNGNGFLWRYFYIGYIFFFYLFNYILKCLYSYYGGFKYWYVFNSEFLSFVYKISVIFMFF